MQLSLHPAPMSRFQILGGYLAWGLAAPGALRSVVKQVALQGLGGPTQALMVAWVGPPSMQGAGAALVDLMSPCLWRCSAPVDKKKAQPTFIRRDSWVLLLRCRSVDLRL